MRDTGAAPDSGDVPGTEGTQRESIPSTSVSPLLNHLLDCREASQRERSGDGGAEPLPTADAILRQAAVEARISGSSESAEEWYRDAGILSMKREAVIAERESPPDPGLAMHNGRERQRVMNRLYLRDMIEEQDEPT